MPVLVVIYNVCFNIENPINSCKMVRLLRDPARKSPVSCLSGKDHILRCAFWQGKSSYLIVDQIASSVSSVITDNFPRDRGNSGD